MVVLLGVAGAAVYVATNEEPPPPKPDIPLDAWVPYWGLDASLPDARQRVPSMREVSPFWFNAVGVDQIVVDPNASPELTAEFMDTVKGLDVDVLPSIIDALPAGEMAAILADPTTRAQHVASHPGVRRRWRLRRHRHRLRTVRIRRRARHLVDHEAELGGVHRGVGRSAAR